MAFILAAAYLLSCILVAYLGRMRAIGFWGFLALSLLLTPIPVLLVLLITLPRKATG